VTSLQRVSTVDALAAELRRAILDGERPGGSRLVERELTEAYGVARHTLRAALRELAAEGLIRLEPHRGATVRHLTAEEAGWLYELRAALELEAAHLALERHGGTLPPGVHDALHDLERACGGGAWSAVVDAHQALHAAIVAAADSPRIAAAHATLAGEMRLFLLQLRPHYTGEGLAEEHAVLLAGLEREGPAALRRHLADAAGTLTRHERR
jgi:DNA-binding GntR family transcriptional regulator